jgi:Family of unknown function (DUF6095)
MATNKKVLMQGVKTLSMSLPVLVTGVFIINSSFKNKEHFLFYYALVLGVLLAGYAVFLMFKGINTLMKSLFDN